MHCSLPLPAGEAPPLLHQLLLDVEARPIETS